jgi:hypothetical protein
MLPNFSANLDTRDKDRRYLFSSWNSTMSYYLETMDGKINDSIHTDESKEECITAEFEPNPIKGTISVAALNTNELENSEDEEKSYHNNNNDGVVSCANKVASTDFVATYLVLSKEKINWISRHARQY